MTGTVVPVHLNCRYVPYLFSEYGPSSLIIVVVVSVVLLGFVALYRYRSRLKGRSQYMYYGSIVILLLTGSVIFFPTTECTGGGGGSAGVSINQNPGVVEITIIDARNLNSMGIVGPDRTRSTMADFEAGTTITLRSNERVISYLNDPENT